MDRPPLELRTESDGTFVIRARGVVGVVDAVRLQQVLVHTVRKVRPFRLVLDLAAVSRLDPINAGTVSAACGMGDDNQVAVYIDNASRRIAEQLAAAGVPSQRLRRTDAVA